MNTYRNLYGRYLESFPWIFAFLSGFVFFEPSLAEYAFLIALPGLIMRMRWGRRNIILAILLLVPMAASALYALIMYKTIDIRFLAIDAYLFSFFIIAQSIFSLEGEKRKHLLAKVFFAMFLAACIGIIAGTIVYATGKNPQGMRIVYAKRLYGFFKDTNVFASYMLLPFFYYAQRFFDEARFRKALPSAAFSVVMSIGVLLTFSRAAWLAYGIGLTILLVRALFSSTKENRVKAIIFALVFSLAISALVSGAVKIGSLDIGSIVKSRLGLLGYDAKRFTAQAKALDMFTKSPVLGVGPGNYELYSRVSAHSLYHRILGERGLLGVMSFLGFAIVVFLALRKKKVEAFLAVLILSLLLESFFIDTLHWRHFWLILILALAAPDLPGKAMPEAS